MAKIQDKFFNRVIEGDLLELSDADKERAGIGGGGTKLYKHKIVVTGNDDGDLRNIKITLLSNNPDNIDTESKFRSALYGDNTIMVKGQLVQASNEDIVTIFFGRDDDNFVLLGYNVRDNQYDVFELGYYTISTINDVVTEY